MSRTYRRNWRGQPIRDGAHGRRCPERNCSWCAQSRTRDRGPQIDRSTLLSGQLS